MVRGRAVVFVIFMKWCWMPAGIKHQNAALWIRIEDMGNRVQVIKKSKRLKGSVQWRNMAN